MRALGHGLHRGVRGRLTGQELPRRGGEHDGPGAHNQLGAVRPPLLGVEAQGHEPEGEICLRGRNVIIGGENMAPVHIEYHLLTSSVRTFLIHILMLIALHPQQRVAVQPHVEEMRRDEDVRRQLRDE